MIASPPQPTFTGPPAGQEPLTIFLASFGRPLYLWHCLDALWRLTRTACRVVLLDNAHPSPLVGEVIAGFERRGLFAEVVRFPTNCFANIQAAYRDRLANAGAFHVYMESDVVIQERVGCWLAEMQRIMMAHPQIGMLGSLIDPGDFVPPDTALKLCGGNAEMANFLAKLQSPERGFINAPQWSETECDFFPTEPPFPISNPPGRLLLLRTDVMQHSDFLPDAQLAAVFRSHGMRPAVTPLVRHRHLSLLNIYDYNDYSGLARNDFFSAPLSAPSQS